MLKFSFLLRSKWLPCHQTFSGQQAAGLKGLIVSQRLVFMAGPEASNETAKKNQKEKESATTEGVQKAIEPILQASDAAGGNELGLERLVQNALGIARDTFQADLDHGKAAQKMALNLIAKKAADIDGDGRITTAQEVSLEREMQTAINPIIDQIEAQALQSSAQISQAAESKKPMPPNVEALALKLKQIKWTQRETLAQPDTHEVAVATKAVLDDLKPWHDGLVNLKKEVAALEKLEPDLQVAEKDFRNAMSKYNIQNPDKFLAGQFFTIDDFKVDGKITDPEAYVHIKELQKWQGAYLNAQTALKMNPDWKQRLEQYKRRIPEVEAELDFLTEQIPARIREEIKKQQTENRPLVAQLDQKSKQ